MVLKCCAARREFFFGGEQVCITERRGKSMMRSSRRRLGLGQDCGGEVVVPWAHGECRELPEELLIKILALLPLPNLLQLRLVCRSWNNPLLRTPFLWDSWVSHQHCWLVMVRKEKRLFAKEFVAYCMPSPLSAATRREGHWLSLSSMLQSPEIAPHVGGKHALRVMCRQVLHMYCIFSLAFCQVAGAQGLMCFLLEAVKQPPPASDIPETRPLYKQTFDMSQPSVLVVHVLTGATYMLPSPCIPQHFEFCPLSVLSMSLLPNASNNCYHVILYDNILTYFEIYDSQSNSWRNVVGHANPFEDLPASADVLNGDLFWLRKMYGVPEELVAYTLEADTWSKICVPSPPGSYGYRPLVTKCRGRLICVDLLISAKMTVDGVGIWELQPASSISAVASWVQVVRTPPRYAKVFCNFRPKGMTDIKFIAFGSIICMTGAAVVTKNFGAEFVLPLVYDFELNSWYHLPAYEGSVEMLGLFAFHPSSASSPYLS